MEQMKENFVISITDTVFINFFVLIKQSQGGLGRFFGNIWRENVWTFPQYYFLF